MIKKKLTAKQEKFARLVAEGKTQSDAYRSSYSAKKMKIETIHNNAHKLTQINEVSTRIDQLKADIKEKSDFLSTINVERQAKLYEEVISAVKERAKIEGIGIEHTYLSVFIKAIEKQCDLLGLEAPKKSEMKITNAAKIVVSPEGEKPEIENGD